MQQGDKENDDRENDDQEQDDVEKDGHKEFEDDEDAIMVATTIN